ncbi:MAG: type I glyceraldehyde-3-phosphate dehydrogenase [Deltaproteobacteria bacterium HGW-Deltaproteobacteria-12]|jgi:glyceraldehyde 3-phosphate dehydrogenase|nr:MAG: type I glyceraldehyde-3-phosphate dehydrogenase [Deltaproteobacteria bacterium HGW-Deltaproteobacteria-12]
MATKIAINGFGRVGRYLVRACLDYQDIEIVAINSRAKADDLAHLLKYDSVHGKIKADVSADKDNIIVNGKKIAITQIPNLADLPWRALGVEIVIESTGKFRKGTELNAHIAAGAKKVILAVPGKGVDGTFVLGVNEETYDPAKHHIISNASCTTNCLGPVVKVLQDKFGIVKGVMTTIHSYTMDQRLLDGSHKDLRRGRAAGMNIVPTSTGAASAIGDVIPALKGKLDGIALRVPTPNVSLVDLAVEISRPVTVAEINSAFKEAAENKLKGILAYSEEELVSIDFTSSSYSSIVDALLTQVVGEKLVKVFSWYDNESGYACRLRDLAIYIAGKG